MKTVMKEDWDALQAALAPFAEAGQKYLYGFPARRRMGDEDEIQITVTLGDLRRAVKVYRERK